MESLVISQTPNETIKMFSDGSCRPNNPGGYGCWGWVALRNGTVLSQAYGCVGHGPGMSNNVAEYHGVIEALRWLQDSAQTGVTLHTDSLLIVSQITGAYRCQAPHLIPLCQQARPLVEATSTTLVWIPRELNTIADSLTRKAYVEAIRKDRSHARVG